MDNLARVISGDDLSELSKAAPQSSLKRIRDIHHYIARLVAEGRRTTDIARETGYSISRISILKADPAFAQLVEMIRPQVEELRDHAYATALQQKLTLRQMMYEEMICRMDENPSDVGWGTMLDVVNSIDDRTDAPKITRSTNLNMTATFDPQYLADRVASGRRRLDQLSAPASAEKEGATSLPADSSPPSKPEG